MNTLEQLGMAAKEASVRMRMLSSGDKNRGLFAAAEALIARKDEILAANEKDIEIAKEKGMKPALIDRLALTEVRIKGMAEGLVQVGGLDDPIGEILSMKQRPNGLMIGKKRVPLGVVGIIYEARPNVTADAFALCFKTGNAVILKGGSDALYSNQKIVEVICDALSAENLPKDALCLITDTDRAATVEFMKMNQYVDVLIPRGSAGLIKATVENSTIPVIETGTGNCHIYVDKTADIDMAVNIIFNAKTQRIGVCNACESLVIHKEILAEALPQIVAKLKEKDVEIRGDKAATAVCPTDIVPASEEDFSTEYLDYIISVKTVIDLDGAIRHINKHSTGHSESIITRDYNASQRFLNEIDSAAVYVNASTRFTDGFEFGFGAEIGISTQKLHARGPMGLEALTTSKFIIYGDGQIRC
ncbi:MAG: glutamate-5-semialdehyde dehydrogenase [Lachnospiraceae bacterium]|nr:glutamate-5-semialdehyde dehydrogenase [Lachnospiraceae bacterium]